jgi:hypothetical protein
MKTLLRAVTFASLLLAPVVAFAAPRASCCTPGASCCAPGAHCPMCHHGR